jgi:hypothetical protein
MNGLIADVAKTTFMNRSGHNIFAEAAAKRQYVWAATSRRKRGRQTAQFGIIFWHYLMDL